MILAALQELYFDIYELWIWQACLYEPLFLYERKIFLLSSVGCVKQIWE